MLVMWWVMGLLIAEQCETDEKDASGRSRYFHSTRVDESVKVF